MNNEERRKIFKQMLRKNLKNLPQQYNERGFSSFSDLWEHFLGLFGRSRKDIQDEIREFSIVLAEESFKDYLFVVDNYEAQELASRPREEWLIMGFSSTDNLFADAEQIHVDEITIRSAIVFWVGDEVMYHKTKQIIETNKIEDYFDLSGAFTLYALKVNTHGELYREAKECERYMISENIISCCKENNIDLTAMHLGHISSDVAQANGFFSLV